MAARIGYIEVTDGIIPTRPAPILRFYSTEQHSHQKYTVEVIDQHGDPHEFITVDTPRVAREITNLLGDHILAALPCEIITLATLVEGEDHA